MSETRNCQNCKNAFVIEDEDFSFYNKIKVPPPTFCPDCRLQRRLVWMKGIEFFKRKCDLCGEMKMSMYHPDAPYIVYCSRCWWSDDWDARTFGRDYDKTRPFLEQYNELLHHAPILGQSIDPISSELSPYTNHAGNMKHCYLVYYSDYNEECMYGYYLTHNKKVIDCTPSIECENAYDSGNIFRSYNVVYCFNARQNVDCMFLRDCDNCTNCFGCANVKNASYMFFNQQLTKEEYKDRLLKINLGSRKEYDEWKAKVHEHWKKYPPKPNYDDFSVNSTGSYYFGCKNCKECYECVDCEDSKFAMLLKLGPNRDCYDYTDWGESAELLYECMTVGGQASNVRFSHESGFSISDVEYSKLTTAGSHHFGCVSMRKPEYCILNKQYTKEEYEKLRAEIIEDMNVRPYITTDGHTYKYGEFFPLEFSPHFYNDTFAHKFFPLTKEQVIAKGLRWFEPEQKEYAITKSANELPGTIQETRDSILEDVIGCATCNRGFKIVVQELRFLQQFGLPLPKDCPFCRIGEKISRWVNNMKLHSRTCDKCVKNFKTHYGKDRAPVIYCKECYQQEFL